MTTIEPLLAASPPGAGAEIRGGRLPNELRAGHAADLSFELRPDRPTVVVNFVSTLDGVVALDRDGRSGGGAISGAFEPDRFLMGLIRAASDAVLIGAGTVRAGSHHRWTPGYVHPPSAPAFADWRSSLGLAPQPTTVMVTASGDLDPNQAALCEPGAPVLIVTTAAGAHRLPSLHRHVEVEVLGTDGRIPARALVDTLHRRGHRSVVCEGGPGLFGTLLADGLVDELFLTMAPQIVGRASDRLRLALVEGVGFDPPTAPWARLASVSQAGDHLFLRYRFSTAP